MAEKKGKTGPPAKKEKGAVTKYDYGAHEGAGFEHQTREDLAIPFISVLQALSPQIETMVKAKAGMLFNTVTEELLNEILFVPATTQHVFTEWVPRDSGGGFVAVYPIDSSIVAEAKARAAESEADFGKLKMENGNDLIETFYIYGITCSMEDATGLAVIAFTSTKIKVYKRLNTRLQTFMVKQPDGRKIRPPLYGHLLRITTVGEENKKGKFHNFVIGPATEGNIMKSLLDPADPRFQAAAECKELVESGVARAAYESTDNGDDDKAPF